MNATLARSQRWKPIAVAAGAATPVAATGTTITDRFERPARALCEVPLLGLSIRWLVVFLAEKTASRRLVPDQLRVTFAAALNAAVVSLDPGGARKP